MTKGLEALKTIKNFLGYNYCSTDLPNELKCVENALERLEAIEGAKPSEALECLDKLAKQIELDEDTDFWEIRNAHKTVEQALLKAQEQEKLLKSGDLSDGYHTFNQLYYQRCILFAALVRQNKDKSWKSFKHSDNKYCFDKNGEWFIVGIDTPIGSYTYHYEKKYWELFECQELECGKEWDGHTEGDVTRLLSLATESKKEKAFEIIKNKNVMIYFLKTCDDVMHYNIYASSENKLTEEEFELLREVLCYE